MDTIKGHIRHEPRAMKETDAKTRVGASTPEADNLNTGEQLSLELQSEAEHQIGTKREKMISKAKDAAGGVKEGETEP